MTATEQYREAVRRHLQDYLGTPVESRTVDRYERLVTALVVAAENHTRVYVNERRQERQRKVFP